MKQPGQLQQPQLPWLPVYCKATTRRDNIIQMWNSKFVYAISIAKMPKRNIDCENFDASGPRPPLPLVPDDRAHLTLVPVCYVYYARSRYQKINQTVIYLFRTINLEKLWHTNYLRFPT